MGFTDTTAEAKAEFAAAYRNCDDDAARAIAAAINVAGLRIAAQLETITQRLEYLIDK